MIFPAFVLGASVALAGGSVPIPESVVRFPETAWWPGAGVRQEINMLEAIRIEAGEAIRWSGPGPAQIRSRVLGGGMDTRELVFALLAAGTWHDTGLVGVYAQVLHQGSQRERQAALVGLMWTVGAAPPPVAQWPTTDEGWAPLAAFARQLEAAVRQRTLVGIWVDSYLRAAGLPHRRGVGFSVTMERCLAAIREVARAEDLDEVVALWPLLASEGDRSHLVRTVEAITAARFGEPVPEGKGHDPAAYAHLGVERFDQFVGSLCGPADGQAAVMSSLRGFARKRPEGGVLGAALEGLQTPYPWVWPALADTLMAFGAPAVTLNRQWPSDEKNRQAIRKIIGYFPITAKSEPVRARRGRR